MHGWLTAAQIGLVYQIIVYQSRALKHLEGSRNSNHGFGRARTLFTRLNRCSAKVPNPGPIAKQRPKTLAALQ
jgi:hypothetical protein